MVIIIRKFILLIFSSIFILHSLLNMCWRQLSKCSREQNDSNFSSSGLNCAIHSKNFLIANISLIFTHTHTSVLYHKTIFIRNLIIQVNFSVSQKGQLCVLLQKSISILHILSAFAAAVLIALLRCFCRRIENCSSRFVLFGYGSMLSICL